jgi:phage repressor protein C with HTH and peptisase S24 domain
MSKDIEILIQRIAAKLHERNLSEREASIDATGKPDAIRYIRVRKAMPGGDRLAALAHTLGTTPEWLLGKNDAQERVEARDVVVSPEEFRRLPRDLPVYGTALGADVELLTVEGAPLGVEQIDVDLAHPTDYMSRPTGAAGRPKMYVVTIQGHSMEPRHDSGRRVLVDGSRSGRPGEDVVVQLRRRVDDHEEIYAVMVKQLIRQRAGSYVLHQFKPEIDFELPAAMVAAVHPIIPWEDVLGY